MKISVKTDYAKMRKYDPDGILEQIKRDLNTNEPPHCAPEPDMKAVAKSMAEYVETINNNAKTQNEMCVWTASGQGELRASGKVIWIRQARIPEMLLWVENARMLIGELPTVFRGRGVIESCAYPFDDWYDTPLRMKKY